MATAKEYQAEIENLAHYARALEEGIQRFANAMATGVRQEDVLRSALERTLGNFKLILAGKPVQDVAETIAEAEHALDTSTPQPNRIVSQGVGPDDYESRKAERTVCQGQLNIRAILLKAEGDLHGAQLVQSIADSLFSPGNSPDRQPSSETSSCNKHFAED